MEPSSTNQSTLSPSPLISILFGKAFNQHLHSLPPYLSELIFEDAYTHPIPSPPYSLKQIYVGGVIKDVRREEQKHEKNDKEEEDEGDDNSSGDGDDDDDDEEEEED